MNQRRGEGERTEGKERDQRGRRETRGEGERPEGKERDQRKRNTKTENNNNSRN